jgi:hypothetical protein
MRYFQETKRFWKTGYRLFHGKFLYYMGGPRNVGQVNDSVSTGALSPELSSINFAVPSIQTLSTFNIGEFDTPSKIEPGMINPIMDTLGKCQDNVFILCADAKKVTAGVDGNGGDVDMFGFESGVPLKQKQEIYEKERGTIESLIELVGVNGNNQDSNFLSENSQVIMSTMTSIIKALSNRIQESRSLMSKQQFSLKKFMNIAGDDWRESRYVYVISALQASLFQLKEFIRNSLNINSAFGVTISKLGNAVSLFEESDELDRSYQCNMLTLLETEETVVLEPRYVKQRSVAWHLIRKQAIFTGSSLHSAIGLRGLKEQKRHFETFIEEKEQSFPQSVQERLKHGTENEIHAIGTLVGRFLPIFFPDTIMLKKGVTFYLGKTLIF